MVGINAVSHLADVIQFRRVHISKCMEGYSMRPPHCPFVPKGSIALLLRVSRPKPTTGGRIQRDSLPETYW